MKAKKRDIKLEDMLSYLNFGTVYKSLRVVAIWRFMVSKEASLVAEEEWRTDCR